MKLYITALFCTLCMALPAYAQTQTDSLCVSLLTCWPGPEIFELYGHEAVRISGQLRGNQIDRVYNYGVFDYGAPNFIARFVKGETDYYVDAVPTDWFLSSYAAQGRKVEEQSLPLTQAQAEQILARLETDMLPANRCYRYKYFSRNCATRLMEHIDAVAPQLNPAGMEQPANTTYREIIRRYNEGYPWYQLGIDVALGGMIDRPVTMRQTMFVPMELRKCYAPSTLLLDGSDDARAAATPWWLSPMTVSCLLFVIALIVWWRGGAIWVRSLWFLCCALSGSLVFYLVFISEHEGASPNLLAWWLNPFWIIPAVTVWFKPLKRLNRAILLLGAIITSTLLLAWPILPQSTNPALFPLMGATVLLCLPRSGVRNQNNLAKQQRNLSQSEA